MHLGPERKEFQQLNRHSTGVNNREEMYAYAEHS